MTLGEWIASLGFAIVFLILLVGWLKHSIPEDILEPSDPDFDDEDAKRYV